jgi:NAD(P)-dependent dehydrogenase (short-subunit alcohol dehydrogenase family)
MDQLDLLLSSGKLERTSLKGQVILITGAGGGVGYEGARACASLGAQVVIAEIDEELGRSAAAKINAGLKSSTCTFIHTDVGDEGSVTHLAGQVLDRFGRIDVVINNATLAPIGAVVDTGISEWDKSYQVNLRGPVLLAQSFLPNMFRQDRGVFICVSSVGDRFMSAYESLKAAQVHLAMTLDLECQGSNVIIFTLGPGLVLTETADRQIGQLASLTGQSKDEFLEMGKAHMLPVEVAGAGYAAAVVYAGVFRGLEIDCRRALLEAGISFDETAQAFDLSDSERRQAVLDCHQVTGALAEQAEGWEKRSFFERQWMKRDFQKVTKLTVEDCLEQLRTVERDLAGNSEFALSEANLFQRLAAYFSHYRTMASGYIKDPDTRETQLQTIGGWQDSAERLDQLLNKVDV